ncbi:MAG: hypothetical protein AAF386_03225 [Pseudomonadota bacterium]
MTFAEILAALKHAEFVTDLALADAIETAKSKPVAIAGSVIWFDVMDDDYDGAMDAMIGYGTAFDQIAALITDQLGSPSAKGFGFDPETGEPPALLTNKDIFCDQYVVWDTAGIILTFAQEDKELPCEIALQPF